MLFVSKQVILWQYTIDYSSDFKWTPWRLKSPATGLLPFVRRTTGGGGVAWGGEWVDSYVRSIPKTRATIA